MPEESKQDTRQRTQNRTNIKYSFPPGPFNNDIGSTSTVLSPVTQGNWWSPGSAVFCPIYEVLLTTCFLI